jgi:hypothetical protein
MAVVVLVLVLLVLAGAAARWGADTRDGRDWQPGHRTPGPLRATRRS